MPFLTLKYTRADGDAIKLSEPLYDWLLLTDAIRSQKTIQLHFEEGEDASRMWISYAYIYRKTPESLLEVLKECAQYSELCRVWVN